MINVRDDAEVARKADAHEAVHYAGVPEDGQCEGPRSCCADNVDVLAVICYRFDVRRLLIIKEGGGTISHELTNQQVTIGRSAENMIVLNDPSVSSRHAQLDATGEDYRLIDLESVNGTRVNGQVITSVLLRATDRIRFGNVEASFENAPADRRPLPRVEQVQARAAEVSSRPEDFGNASPFPKRRSERDPVRPLVYGVAALAVLAFVGSMIALAQMHSPIP